VCPSRTATCRSPQGQPPGRRGSRILRGGKTPTRRTRASPAEGENPLSRRLREITLWFRDSQCFSHAAARRKSGPRPAAAAAAPVHNIIIIIAIIISCTSYETGSIKYPRQRYYIIMLCTAAFTAGFFPADAKTLDYDLITVITIISRHYCSRKLLGFRLFFSRWISYK